MTSPSRTLEPLRATLTNLMSAGPQSQEAPISTLVENLRLMSDDTFLDAKLTKDDEQVLYAQLWPLLRETIRLHGAHAAVAQVVAKEMEPFVGRHYVARFALPDDFLPTFTAALQTTQNGAYVECVTPFLDIERYRPVGAPSTQGHSSLSETTLAQLKLFIQAALSLINTPELRVTHLQVFEAFYGMFIRNLLYEHVVNTGYELLREIVAVAADAMSRCGARDRVAECVEYFFTAFFTNIAAEDAAPEARDIMNCVLKTDGLRLLTPFFRFFVVTNEDLDCFMLRGEFMCLAYAALVDVGVEGLRERTSAVIVNTMNMHRDDAANLAERLMGKRTRVKAVQAMESTLRYYANRRARGLPSDDEDDDGDQRGQRPPAGAGAGAMPF